MAIISDTMQRNATPQAQVEPRTGDTHSDDVATPEEQQAYERVVLSALRAIYSEQTHQSIVNMLKSADPPEALAKTASTILLELDRKSGEKIPEVVILPAAADILGELADLAKTAKLFEVNERTVAAAMQKLVISLGEAYDANPADLQAIIQSMPQEEIQAIVQQQSQYAQAGAQPPVVSGV